MFIIVKAIYWQQTATIKIDGNMSKAIEIQRGVRQGCVLSPILFNVYSELIFTNALSHSSTGVKINGQRVNNVRSADDTVLMTDSDHSLQILLDRINESCEKMGMKINIAKTKVMKISKNKNVPLPIYVNHQ